jgi:O-antigen ligase
MIYVLDLIPWWYKFFAKIQTHITINVGTPDRIMGLTLEPSWFADQISALWLPWVFPAAIQNRTVYKKRWGFITVERILLVWMLLVLVFTLSRAGFVVALVVLTVGVLFFIPRGEKKDQHEEITGIRGRIVGLYRRVPRIVRYAVLSVVLLAVVSIIVYYVGKDNKYINRMWLYWVNYSELADTVGTRSIGGFFRYIGFGPRFVYWETAYRLFERYPLFGVGLGNYTFHFLEGLPSVQIGYVPEILTRIVPDHIRVVTPKNYFARILAETGLLGMAAFVTFLISLGAGGLYLWLDKNPKAKFWGAGALLGLIAFLVDTFSYDSLAIPNPWIVFGLITAAFQIYYHPKNSVKEKSN